MARQRHDDPRITERKNVAGRFGFILGIVAAIVAAVINLRRAPQPLTWTTVLLAVLLAALNVPFGIAFGLLGERLSRPKRDDR